MSIIGLGKPTPFQLALLRLAGIVVEGRRLIPSPDKDSILDSQRTGLEFLRERTGEDFGEDVTAWFDYLLKRRIETAVDHPYGFSVMREFLAEKGWKISYDESQLEELDAMFLAELDEERGVFEVTPNEWGWVRCPFCDRKFKWESSGYADGRHSTCHSRIVVRHV